MRKTIWCSGEIHTNTVIELQEKEYWQVKSSYEGTHGWYITVEKLTGAAHDSYRDYIKRERTEGQVSNRSDES